MFADRELYSRRLTSLSHVMFTLHLVPGCAQISAIACVCRSRRRNKEAAEAATDGHTLTTEFLEWDACTLQQNQQQGQQDVHHRSHQDLQQTALQNHAMEGYTPLQPHDSTCAVPVDPWEAQGAARLPTASNITRHASTPQQPAGQQGQQDQPPARRCWSSVKQR